MTNWTWKTLDYSKVQVGDIIEDDYTVAYVVDIKNRNKHSEQIEPERRITLGEYDHSFSYRDGNGGYSFDCYSDGTIYRNHDQFSKIVRDPELINNGIRYSERSFNIPAVIRCVCGGEVVLNMIMTNTCDKCERDYNVSGQLLAPRSQWGEETGEYLGDILMSDRSI